MSIACKIHANGVKLIHFIDRRQRRRPLLPYFLSLLYGLQGSRRAKELGFQKKHQNSLLSLEPNRVISVAWPYGGRLENWGCDAGGDAGQNWLEGGSKSNLASLQKDVCVAGEAVTVQVHLSNPLGIPLVISRLSILAHLQQPDHLQGADGSILVSHSPSARTHQEQRLCTVTSPR